MKKFLGFYLPAFILVGAVAFFMLHWMVENHKPVLIWMIGDGELVSPAKNATVKVNGIEFTDAKIFDAGERFFFVVEKERNLGFDLLIISKSKNDVLLPNGDCREVLFSNYLVLSDCAKGKFYGYQAVTPFDTQLKISDSNIDFVVPNHKIEIQFKGE